MDYALCSIFLVSCPVLLRNVLLNGSWQSLSHVEDSRRSNYANGESVENALCFGTSLSLTELADGNGGAAEKDPWLQVSGSRYFANWLAECQISLAFTTYQAGKLLFLGRKVDGQLSVFERTFNHCMGMFASTDARSLWMSSKYQVWRFENVLAAGQQHNGYDALYIPRVAHTTGDLDIHDIVVEESGRVVFVNTLFNCLGTISDTGSFSRLWHPPFISQLVPQDRCHLNGLALKEGRAKFATVVSQSDVVDGWRDKRRDGGCVLDIPLAK